MSEYYGLITGGPSTTGLAARTLGGRYIGIDLNTAYHDDAIQPS